LDKILKLGYFFICDFVILFIVSGFITSRRLDMLNNKEYIVFSENSEFASIDTIESQQQYNRERFVDGFTRAIESIHDPRRDDCDHLLLTVIFIAVSSVICGATSYYDMETFGKEQKDWLSTFLPKTTSPSHDTFRRVLYLLKPNELFNAFLMMLKEWGHLDNTKHIAIDGKKLRGSGCQLKGLQMLNSVSAWDTVNGISLGQLVTRNGEDKEVGEFNTIPLLVGMLDVQGKLVSVDAGGCYAEIVHSIVIGGGDYVIGL
jgi:hypothetical protein